MPPDGLDWRVAGSNGTLLGRRAELAAVDDVLEQLGRRRGAVLAFSGEGGIGKTRLLDELCGARRRAPERWCCAAARRSSSASCRSASGRTRSPSTPSSSASTGSSGWSATSCPSWPRCCRRSGAIPAGLQDERYRTHRAVRVLLEALAQRQPVVLALDDLHWADDASLELVAHLLRRPPRGRVALALAFRPAPIRPLLATALATAERDGVGDRAHARRAVVRRRRDAARHRRSPAPCAARSTRPAAATRSSCSSSRASTPRGAASRPSRPARACRGRSRGRSSRRSPR